MQYHGAVLCVPPPCFAYCSSLQPRWLTMRSFLLQPLRSYHRWRHHQVPIMETLRTLRKSAQTKWC